MENALQKPRIVFGVLSSRDTVEAITMLADLLAPHQIIVHHDFTKFPDFNVERENVTVLPDPVVTSWGGWSLVDATLKLMQFARQHFEFDYFQLLSETCMPVRPIEHFEAFLAESYPDAMMDLQPILSPADPAFISHGWRYYPSSQFGLRLFRKFTYIAEPVFRWQQRGLINLKCLRNDIHGRHILLALLLKCSYRILWSKNFFSQGQVKVCAVGGQWFGLSSDMLNRVLRFIEQTPCFLAHYQNTHIPDESFFQTLVYHLQPRRLFSANHMVFWHSNGTGPDHISEVDLAGIINNKEVFFARKFALTTSDPAKKLIVEFLNKNYGGNR